MKLLDLFKRLRVYIDDPTLFSPRLFVHYQTSDGVWHHSPVNDLELVRDDNGNLVSVVFRAEEKRIKPIILNDDEKREFESLYGGY